MLMALVADYPVIPRITAGTLIVLGFDSWHGQNHSKAVTNLRRFRHRGIEVFAATKCPMTSNVFKIVDFGAKGSRQEILPENYLDLPRVT